MKTQFIKLAFLSMLITLSSCEKDEEVVINNSIPEEESLSSLENELRVDFAKALSSSMKESQELRSLIKNEALKKFDKDYDVLYQLIKNESLEDDRTVRDLILSHYENQYDLSVFENENPLLTIFVPKLPENSFSAEIWDVNSEIPDVAVRLNNSNEVPIIDTDGKEYTLQFDEIPAYPIIVVKDSERVTISNNSTSGLAAKSIDSKSDFDFKFIDNAFDGTSENDEKASKLLADFAVDQRVKDAYDIYSNVNGWQRDYIYYNLTSTNTRGEFNFAFKEHITSFELVGDPMAAYLKIADQDDPRLSRGFTRKSSPWTGGAFEFKVSVLLNAQNGIGEEFTAFFSANPEELFEVEYEQIFGFLFRVSDIETKRMKLDIPIINWDLENYATSFKVSIEEVDNTETVITTNTRAVEFANNFGIDPQDGILKKLGLKFGSSLKSTETQTVQSTVTLGSDKLGDVVVNFADDVIIREIDYSSIQALPFDSVYEIRDYSSGSFKINFEPKQVQPF